MTNCRCQGIACETEDRERFEARGLAGLRADTQAHSSDTAPPVWRAPECPKGLAAVPVGGSRAKTEQNSHIISYGHSWRPSTDLAIATTSVNGMK